jgi:enoyl-CoA hydratase
MSEFEIEHSDGVVEFRFNRPESRNSLTFEMYQALELVCQKVKENGDRVVVIAANGDKAFASGTDISNFRHFKDATDAINYEAMIGRVIDSIRSCPVPVIASLHGIVAGGGAAIAAAADIRIATPDTRFGMPIARTLGNCLSVANLSRLVQLLGESRVRYLMLTAQFLPIDALTQSGFVSEVMETPEACDARCQELARHMQTLAPRTLSATRDGLKRLAEQDLPADRDLIERCYLSADFAEGIEAFFAKRPANWSGL